IVEYVDPVTGLSVLPTMSFRVQLFKPGFAPRWQRRTSSTLFCVFAGSGRSEIEGEMIEWTTNDVFVVPSWHWYRNVNATDEDLIVLSVSDSPALERLGFYRAQGRDDGDRVYDIVSDYREMSR